MCRISVISAFMAWKNGMNRIERQDECVYYPSHSGIHAEVWTRARQESWNQVVVDIIADLFIQWN